MSMKRATAVLKTDADAGDQASVESDVAAVASSQAKVSEDANTQTQTIEKKPGSRRTLDSKLNKAVSKTDADSSDHPSVESDVAPSAEVEVAQETSTKKQSMEERLAAYQQRKKEKESQKVTSKVTPAVGSRSLRSRTTTLQAGKNDGAQRKLRSTTDTNGEKPVAKDTIFQARPRRSEDDLDDNIHPLARTVVKVAPKTYPSTVHDEESHTKDNKTNTRVSTSTLPKISHISAVQEPTSTPLPLSSHLDVLFANFKALEDIIMFKKGQGQLSFYHKLKKPVELRSSRNFEIKHLAQFKTLWPEGYKFTEAPCLFEGAKTRSILIEMQELKEDENEIRFTLQVERRRKLFMDRLHDHIKKYHQEFLTSTTPPRTDTYPHQWHPDFDLESVPHIEGAEVPLLKPKVIDASNLDLRLLGNRKELQQPLSKETSSKEASSKETSSKETLSKVTSSSSSSSSPSATSSNTEEKPLSTTEQIVANVTPESSASKDLSSLERLKEQIRQKQLEKKESIRGLATPEEKRRALTFSRLPSVFDLIRFKRVDVTPVKTLVEQVVKSSRMPISDVEGKECLEVLAETLPEWCSVFSLNDGSRYFKVLKDDGQGNKLEHDEKALRARLVAKSIRKLM
ncbi:replication licensing factor Cdt1 [Mortierella sp. GBA43]|nr:replication licensing factor Cdt1 [Mortierella sp. GBA43]